MFVARLVRIRGRVQGVFFRAWTAEQAKALDVAGWVRNCPDGAVEAHLEGEQWAIQQLIEQLRRGPPSAEVENLVVEETETIRTERFEVRH